MGSCYTHYTQKLSKTRSLVSKGWRIENTPRLFRIDKDMNDPHTIPEFLAAFNDLQRGAFKQAIRRLNVLLELEPRSSEAYLLRAAAHIELSDFEAAVDDYTNAVCLNPDASLYRERAVLHLRQKNYDAAIADYNQALQKEPGAADAYKGRGLAYRYRGLDEDEQDDLVLAISDLTHAIELSPDDWELYDWRANIYHSMGDNETAHQDLTVAIALNSSSAQSYIRRAGSLFSESRFEDAVADYSRALDIDPATPEVYSWRGPSLREHGGLGFGHRRLYARDRVGFPARILS